MKMFINSIVTFLFTVTISVVISQTTKGESIHIKIPSPSLENALFDTPTEQPIVVYLPPSYSLSNNKFPVIYFLPGFTTPVSELTDGTFQGLELKKSVDELINERRIAEMIIVVANGYNFLGGCFYVNSPVTGNWEDFIVKDVVRYIDISYKTLTDAASRGIAGSSMGGFGSLNLAMLHPDVFGAVYSLSPGLFDENGLSDQGMFTSQDKIDKYLAKEEEFKAMTEEEAKTKFRFFISELYSARSTFEYFWAFSYAYGAAFSPNPNNKPPYIDYPYHKSGKDAILDSTILNKYENGFGNLTDKIGRYKDNLLKLNAIKIDYGANDYYKWIINGSICFSNQLKNKGIPHELESHDGGHEDKLRERIEEYMLPFFSDNLKFDTNSNNK